MTTIAYDNENSTVFTEMKDDDNSAVIVSVVFKVLICIVGLFGNFIVIFIIVVLKEYQKSVTHWYVLQLSLADSIFLLTLPFKVSEDLKNEWIYSNTACKTVETILFVNYYGSILFLMIMSIDRYIAVCHSFSDTLQRLRKRRIPYFVIVPSTWIIAILLCIPVMLYSHKTGESPNCKCSYNFPKNYVEKCIEQGFHTQSEIEDCLKIAKGKDDFNPDEPHCRMQTTLENHKQWQTDSQNTNEISYDDSYYGEDYYNSNEDSISNSGDKDLNSSHWNHHDGKTIPAANCNYWQSPEGWKQFLIYNFVAMFILPVLVMSVCYGLIIRKLSSSMMKTTSTMSTSSFVSTNPGSGNKKKRRKSSSRSEKDRRRVTIMCAALVSFFIICWLPFHSVHLAKIVGIPSTNENFCNILPLVGTLLAYLNSALNPFLYSFFSYNFGKRLSNASSKVKGGIRRQSSSTSVFGSVRQRKKQSKDVSRSNDATLPMKTINKPTTETDFTKFERLHSFDTQEQFRSIIEPRHHQVITTARDDVIAEELSFLE